MSSPPFRTGVREILPTMCNYRFTARVTLFILYRRVAEGWGILPWDFPKLFCCPVSMEKSDYGYFRNEALTNGKLPSIVTIPGTFLATGSPIPVNRHMRR